MDTRSSYKLLLTVGTFWLVCALQVNGSPVKLQDKPPMCPYGRCFIDRCERICLCIPNEGNTTCTKEDELPADCSKPPPPGNCPLGRKYKNPLWNEHFVCYCNDDASQTYECFDLSKQTPAEAHELMNISRRRRNQKPERML